MNKIRSAQTFVYHKLKRFQSTLLHTNTSQHFRKQKIATFYSRKKLAHKKQIFNFVVACE